MENDRFLGESISLPFPCFSSHIVAHHHHHRRRRRRRRRRQQQQQQQTSIAEKGKRA
jgi:hypothetical protein